MTRVGDLCRRVRSKNAGPFRLTIDCFCDDDERYRRLRDGLDAERVAAALDAADGAVNRHALDDIRVLKFSLPRPGVQGGVGDRDQHGAQIALVIAALTVDASTNA